MNALVAAFFNSLNGFAVALRSERAVRQEVAVLVVALPAASLLAPDRWTWLALVGTILVVLAVELLNTGVEKLCDHVHPERHPAIGAVKDMGSAAVLCTLVLAGLAWGAALLQAIGF